MRIAKAYLLFEELVNRSATNNNTSVDIPRFVSLFNWSQIKYVEWLLEKRNEDDVRDISKLLIPQKELKLEVSKSTYSAFTLPKNYFNFANLFIEAKKQKCTASDFLLFEARPDDVHELLADSNNDPSFEYRETFYHFIENSVMIYKKDFEISKSFMTYYRYPQPVDMEGYIRDDQTQSLNIDPEFDDKVVQKILSIMVKEFSAINNDQTSYAISKDRLSTEA